MAGQGERNLQVFRFLGFNVRTTKTGHKIMTQKFTKNISYMIHPSPCHIIYSHVQTIVTIAINTTERQQFSAVTVRLKSGFLKVFLKNVKNPKIWTFEGF